MRERKLYLDQYGQRFFAATVQELRAQIGVGGKSRVSVMYRDLPDGRVMAVGYVIGGHWLTRYRLDGVVR